MDLEEEFGLVGYAVYWKTLELCGSNWNRVSEPKFEFPARKLKKKFGVSVRKLEQIFRFCDGKLLLSFNKTSENFCFHIPKLAIIADNYTKDLVAAGKKLAPHIEENKSKNKKKNNINRDALHDPSLDLILKDISTQCINTWFSRYKDSTWIKNNLLEAVAYYQAKGDEQNWGLKLTTWLSRAKARGGPEKPLYDPSVGLPGAIE